MTTNTQMKPSVRQHGFSLIELMIAMTIGLIALAGIGYLFLESRQAFRSMDSLSRMQESARYALETMARDIRMAGYRGCASSNVELKSTVNTPTGFAYDFSVPINGFDATGATWSPVLPTGTGGLSGVSIQPNTDAFTLRGAFGGGSTITDQPGGSSAVVKVATPNDFAPDDIVMATNCALATVFQITNPYGKGGETVVHNTGTGTPGNSTKDLAGIFVGGELIKMQTKSYFIRESASSTVANKRYSLWQFDNYKPTGGDNPAEIAEGVENMQIEYGSDADSNGIVDSYTSAAVVADWKKVAAVRISLLVAGNDDNVASSKQKYNYNKAAVTADDFRLRQVFTTTVGVRNRIQ